MQNEIEELLKRLSTLREEEDEYNTSIAEIDKKVKEVVQEFKPRQEVLGKEKAEIEVQENKLKEKMVSSFDSC